MGFHRWPLFLGDGNAGVDGSPTWESEREAKGVKGEERIEREVGLMNKGLRVVVENEKSKGRVTMALGIAIAFYFSVGLRLEGFCFEGFSWLEINDLLAGNNGKVSVEPVGSSTNQRIIRISILLVPKKCPLYPLNN